jgi:hypothetical protein
VSGAFLCGRRCDIDITVKKMCDTDENVKLLSEPAGSDSVTDLAFAVLQKLIEKVGVSIKCCGYLQFVGSVYVEYSQNLFLSC